MSVVYKIGLSTEMEAWWLALVLRASRFYAWGQKKNVWSLLHVFHETLNAIKWHHCNLFVDKMACVLCLAVQQPEQRHWVEWACLKIVTKTLLKLCHNDPITSEALSQPHTFLCKPCRRNVKNIDRLEKALIQKKAAIKSSRENRITEWLATTGG